MVDKSTPGTRKSASTTPGAGHTHGRAAAQHVDETEHLVIDLPILGAIRMPRPEQLAYYGAVGVLVALEIVEWPIALLLTAGHILTQQQHSRALHELGEGLEKA